MNWNEETPYFVIIYSDNDNDDTSWTSNLKFPFIIESSKKYKNVSGLHILKFIIDSYESMPQNIIFINQYEKKFYHFGSLIQLLNDDNFEINYHNSKSEGYWNFGNQILGSVYPNINKLSTSGWWKECMEPHFGSICEYGDFTNGKKRYSQFVVSRDRIKSLPLEFYTNMYEWINNNTIIVENLKYNAITLCPEYTCANENLILLNHSNSSYNISKYLDWSWELIFTSWKIHEHTFIVLQDRNEHKFIAIYGSGKYYRNVTSYILKHFIQNKDGGLKIVIPSSVNFNDIFGDVTPGTVKKLIIHIDNNMIEIDEHRNIVL